MRRDSKPNRTKSYIKTQQKHFHSAREAFMLEVRQSQEEL